MLRLPSSKDFISIAGTSPVGRWGASATQNRISVPIREQSMESSRRVCCAILYPGRLNSSTCRLLKILLFPTPYPRPLNSPNQTRNPGLFNTFPPHLNDIHKVIDTQYTFVVSFLLCSQCQIQARRAATPAPCLHSSLPLGFRESPVTNHESLSLLESTLAKVYQNKGL